MLRLCLLACLLTCGLGLPKSGREYDSVQVYDISKIITEDGFASETHHVVTSDGYVLEMDRIPRGRGPEDGAPKPVVFLMHGLLGSAAAYISIGPEKSMGYNLADAGFDVWMGNARGVLNSRNHLTLDPDNENDKMAFFDYTFEQIATIDVPAMIDYILEYTGNEKLHYIGHSQGGTVFLVLNTMAPEYNEKFASVHLLAGVGYKKYFPNTVLRLSALTTDVIYALAENRGIVEILGPGWNTYKNCYDDDSTDSCPGSTIQNILMPLLEEVDVFASASLKQIAHYGQNIRDRKFRRWNYGLQNLAKYGRLSPPEYDLSLITANVTMHYSLSDELLSEQDVLDMAASMPYTEVRKVARDTFTHNDYMGASDAKELVTDYIIELIGQKRT